MNETEGYIPPEASSFKTEPKIDLEGGQQMPRPEFAPNLDPEIKSKVKDKAGRFVEGVMGEENGVLGENYIAPGQMRTILRHLEIALVPGTAAEVTGQGINSPEYTNTAQVMKDFIAAARERLSSPKASE